MRLTKHTTTSITAARPSIYTPIGNEPPWPRSIQFTENSMGAPPPGTMPATNNRAKTRKTSAGSVGMAVMINCWPKVCTSSLLAPHGGNFVHVDGPPRAEHGEHDSEPHGDLRRGYGDHEHGVADAESSCVREVVSEGDEREIDAVYHELDAHEDHDGVAAYQGSPRPYGEKDGAHHEISFEWRGRDQGVEELLYLCRDLGHYSRTPLSTPSPTLRRLTTMAATTATRSSTEATSNSRVKISAPWLTPSRSRPKAPTCRGPLPASVPPQSSAEGTEA